MQRSTQLLLLVVGIVATAAMATFLTDRGPPTVPLTDEEAADEVTIYQNGLASVELTRSFVANESPLVLTLPVPATTLENSIRVTGEDVVVEELRSTASLSGPIQSGDEVVVRTANHVYRGTLARQAGDSLVLTNNGSTTLVSGDKLESVRVRGTSLDGEVPEGHQVGVRVETTPGNRSVQVDYLARGPQWAPSYHLDLPSGEATFFATLTGVQTWRNVTLNLVSGAPNTAGFGGFDGGGERDFGQGDDAADAPAGGGSSGVSRGEAVGELHRYRLNRTTNLTQGETLRLPVRDGQLEIDRSYLEASSSVGFGQAEGRSQSLAVLERYEVSNGFREVLPGGVTNVYRDGTWVGQDRIETLAVGESTNLTVARSQEVTAELTLTSVESQPEEETRTYRLVVDNRRTDGDAADVQARLTYPSFRTSLVDATPEPTRVQGTTVVWDASVAAGASETFELTYEQSDR